MNHAVAASLEISPPTVFPFPCFTALYTCVCVCVCGVGVGVAYALMTSIYS